MNLTLTRPRTNLKIRVNEDVLNTVLAVSNDLVQRIKAGPPTVEGLLAMPGVVDSVEAEESVTDRKALESPASVLFTGFKLWTCTKDGILTNQDLLVRDGKIVAIDSLAPRLRFKYATEKEPGNVVQVESDRNPPENFRVGIGASIKGTYDREKKFFKARQVSTNCPSRYDPKEELKKIEEQQQGAPPSYEAPPRSTSRAVPRGIRTDGSDVVGR